MTLIRPQQFWLLRIKVTLNPFKHRLVNKFSSRRYNGSGRSNNSKRKSFQLDALPFTVSPDKAYQKFRTWAIDEQGLGPFLSVGGQIGSAQISAAYTPFWSFDVNIRFMMKGSFGNRSYSWRPEPFYSAYRGAAPNGAIYVPGLSAYAGYSYRRNLLDPVHNTTPVFKNDFVPFGSWMLEPLKFHGGETRSGSPQHLEIFPDPWNATRERAFSVIYDELTDMANEQYMQQNSDAREESVQVEVERVSARRIYLPTYIVEYTILGITYKAFLSGCDDSIIVSGVSHKSIFSGGSTGDSVVSGATSFLSHRVFPVAASALQLFGLRPFIALGKIVWGAVSRIAMRFHIVGLLGGGALLAYRKLLRPYMDDRAASAEWERQREHDAQMAETYDRIRHFRDSGSAKMYFYRSKQQILRELSGEEGRQQEEQSYDWYKQWEEWARQQWEQAQREAYREQQKWQQQYQQQQYQHYQQDNRSDEYSHQKSQRRTQQTKHQQSEKEEFIWDFDPNDPHSVLGVSRNASKDEVSRAFRREMLKHHPDTQAGASEKDKRRATERSKLISDAYRTIKSGHK